MKELGYGEEYKYAHDFEANFTEQNFCLMKFLQQFFEPGENTRERELRQF